MIDSTALANAGISPYEYESLSKEEKDAVDQILREIAKNSTSSSYENLYYIDYDEIPVDFDTFISDDQYLGKSTRNGQFLYPFWRNETKKIFSRSDINEVALSGSIGIGKSTAACIMMAYHLYRTMCMKDPQSFFNLSPGSEITYAFLNNTLSSSYGVGFNTVQSFLKESPWFLKHGTLVGRNDPTYYPEKGFGFLVGSRSQHTLGRHIISAMIDEVSFAPGQNVNYEKSKIMSLYTNIRRRMESRFMVQGHMYGLLFLVSSKATDSSFLEAYIADQVSKGYPIYVVDQPLWKVKPGAYSGRFFKVAVGNKYLKSRVIKASSPEELKTQIEGLEKQGLRILDVPVEHKQAFDQDIDKALQDIAGISTSVVTKAFSSERLMKCVSEELENPFSNDIVTLGMNDQLRLQDFFDESKIPDNIKGAPVFIHLDASVSGDKTGLSGVAIAGTKTVQQFSTDIDTVVETVELKYQQVFTVSIKAPSDSEISFEKTRQFIYYLKDEVGLNIKIVTTDGFQSVDTRQILQTKGYNVGYTSLDRTPDGYDTLRSAINDQRVVILKGCNLLYEEITDLEKDNMTHKYDHPLNGSKDAADSFAGALFDASKYKDEFLFWSPEDYSYEELNKKDYTQVDYQEDLRKQLFNEFDKYSDHYEYFDENILIL